MVSAFTDIVKDCPKMRNLPKTSGGTAAAAPQPFRPSDPALCGSCPLVTPYYCIVLILCISFCVYIIVCVYVSLVVFVVFFLFCSISFSTLILLVGSFDL